MLDRAGDADGDVKLWRDDLAGLADLVVVRHEAGIDGGAAGADGGAQLVGDRFDQLEILDRKRGGSGKSVSVRLDLGVCSIIKKKPRKILVKYIRTLSSR